MLQGKPTFFERKLRVENLSFFLLGFLVCTVFSSIGSLSKWVGDTSSYPQEFGAHSCDKSVSKEVFTETSLHANASTSAPTSSPENNPTDTVSDAIKDDIWTPQVQQEVIPPSLQNLYKPSALPFNVTRSMLRRSRLVVGNVNRFHAYLKKLRDGICTNVVVFGGSVTKGHNAGGGNFAYPKHFMDWLNVQYPCKDSTGQIGNHTYHIEMAGSSQGTMSTWTFVAEQEKIDLAIVEFNVNDYFIKGIPHALEDKGRYGDTDHYAACWYNEVLFRRLLLLRKPDPIAVVLFNADYVGRPWTNKPLMDPKESRKLLFKRNGEAIKYWMASLYELPLISAVSWMLPMAGKLGRKMQFSKNYTFSTSRWHTDQCCHPFRNGHRLLSLVLAYNFNEEMKQIQAGEMLSPPEEDFTMAVTPIMRTPAYLSDYEDGVYVLNANDSEKVFLIDFHDGHNEDWRQYIASNDGWKWFADNREKDKFGLILENASGVGHLSFHIQGRNASKLEISFLVSYENFGTALAWFSPKESAPSVCGAANITAEFDLSLESVHKLDGHWDKKASIPSFGLYDANIGSDDNTILHICLMPPSDRQAQNNELNKFKLTTIRLF